MARPYLIEQFSKEERTPSITNNASIFTVGEGKNDAGGDVDYSDSVENGLFSGVIGGNSVFQFIKNGNFEDTSDWVGSGAILSVTSNKLTITGTGIISYPTLYQTTDVACVDGKKVFVKCHVKITNSDCSYIDVKLIGTTGGEITARRITSPAINQIYTIEEIETVTSALSGNIRIGIFHVYADAATANGKVMEIQRIMALDMGNTPSDKLYSLSISEMSERFPNWLSYGTKSTFSTRIKSVGKNLFKEFITANTGLEFKRVDENTITIKAVGGTGVLNVNLFDKRFKPNAQYTFSGSHYEDDDTKNTRPRIIYTDGSWDEWATPTLVETAFEFTSDVGKSIEKIVYNYSNAGGTTTIKNLMVEEGTSKTDYKPYIEDLAYLPEVGKSLPNGVNDEIRILQDGSCERGKNVSDDFSTNNDNIQTYLTSPVNVDVIIFPISAFPDIATQTENADGKVRVEGMAETTYGNRDNIDNVGKFYTTATTVGFITAKGAYTSTDDAKLNFPLQTVAYQLASPVITPLPDVAPLQIFENGTIIIDPYFHPETPLTYTTASNGLSWTIPVSEIEKIEGIDGEEYTEISPDRYTLAGDGLSVRIYIDETKTVEVADNTVWNIFAPIKPEESTIPEITATYPLNKLASDSNLNSRALINSNHISYLQDQVAMLIVLNS